MFYSTDRTKIIFSVTTSSTLHSLSIYVSIYLSIYGYTALCWTLASFSHSWSFTQSAGLLVGGISPSKGRYLHTGQHKHRANAHTHPFLKDDSNPRSQSSSERRRFMP
jgi:hypothetical protein